MTYAEMSENQQNFIDSLYSIYLIHKLGKDIDEDMKVIYHDYAVNNTPGWNVFFRNIRIEINNEVIRMRFSVPYEENKYNSIINCLEKNLNLKQYNIEKRLGVKYIFELDFDNKKYNENLEKIPLLVNKILDITN